VAMTLIMLVHTEPAAGRGPGQSTLSKSPDPQDLSQCFLATSLLVLEITTLQDVLCMLSFALLFAAINLQ
jgi:hypothetical protein